MYVRPDNFCDRLNLVWLCTIMSQSIRWKYHFAIFKVKATIISTRSSKIETFTTQNSLIIHHHKMGLEDIMKRFLLLLLRAWDRMWPEWLWTGLLPLLVILISRAGVSTGSSQENVERTSLLWWIYLFIKFISQWFKCVI